MCRVTKRTDFDIWNDVSASRVKGIWLRDFCPHTAAHDGATEFYNRRTASVGKASCVHTDFAKLLGTSRIWSDRGLC